MGRKTTKLPQTEEARLFHRCLLEEGVLLGQEIGRQTWDDMVIAVWGVGSRAAINQRTRVGQALRLWRVTEAHGKGGRGYVTVLDPQAAFAAPAEEADAVMS